MGFNLYDEQSMRTKSKSNTYANLIDEKKMEKVQKKLKDEANIQEIINENCQTLWEFVSNSHTSRVLNK